ncbi:MAG: hypothetical protein IH884_01100 [Myxococcales bacterium]|nr:hypothetical protein [Myxococcales bacterium]
MSAENDANSGSRAGLGRVVAICGAVNLVVLGALALASTWLNLLKPLSAWDGRLAFYRGVAEGFPLLGAWLPSDVHPDPWAFLAGYLGPIAVSTAISVGVLVLLHRHRDALPDSLPRLLFGFGAAFAVVSATGLPILADDFFVSLSWGRMIRAGVNPYYVAMDPVFAIGTPLEAHPWPHRMSYGPLWGAIAAGVTMLGGGRTLLSGVLLKALVTGAWIGCLWLVRAILADRSRWQLCAGLLLVGWLPLGPTQIVGEGRNDAFVALLVLAWVHARGSGRPVPAVLALAASVGVKYVTAPLFLVDLVHQLRERRDPWRFYLLPGAAALALLLAMFVPFHLGRDVLGAYIGNSELLRIHFLTLREAVMTFELWSGVGLGPLPELARLVFPGIAVVVVVRYARGPDREGFHRAALAVMCAVLFGLGGLVFPWYLVWLLVLAALSPSAALSRWTFGMVLLAPVVFMPENAFPPAGFVQVHVAGLAWYLGALGLTLLLRRPLGRRAES